MKKNYRNLIVYLIIYFLITLSIFGCGYYFLVRRFIADKTTNNLEYLVESVKVSLENKISNDINEYMDIINSYDLNIQKADLITQLELNEDIKKVFNTNVHFAYYDQNRLFLNQNEYQVTNNEYNNVLSIYSFNELNNNINSTDKNIVIRYNDIIVYFKVYDYLSDIFDNNFPKNYYLIIEKTGHIVFQKEESEKNVLYFDYIQDYNLKYDYHNISDKLYSHTSGNDVLNFDGTKSILIYKPIFNNDLNDSLFIAFAFEYHSAIGEMSLIINLYIICALAIVLLVGAMLFIFFFKLMIQEQDIYIKPGINYTNKPIIIKINKKGSILTFSKSCYKTIKDFRTYKSINDFNVFDNKTSINDLITLQIPFVMKFKSFTEEDIYIHFIALKMFNKYILVGEDVTIMLEEQIHNREIAMYNNVTHLPNKNVMDKKLEKILSSPAFSSTNVSISALEIIDFNKINQLYGYSSADKMVQEVARIMNDSISEYNGDITIYNIRTSLFIVLFIDSITQNEIVSWARTLVDSLLEPINIKVDYLVQVTPKMGIFTITDEMRKNIKVNEIYDCVITSLDRSKNSSLTKISVYNNDLGKALSRDQMMEEDLKDAITNDEFEMYYQPQYNIKTNKIVGMEALVRWQNPKYKTESPEKYITIAEKNGMIIELGRLVINKVFKYAKSIENADVSVSLNVSPVQLLQTGFVYELLKAFEDYELKSGAIAIEITETFLMENKEKIINKIRLLKDKGFKIHLDDFGIGYSSMLYLKDLPVDAIKIDKEFCKYIATDKITKTIVTKIVQLGLSLNLDLIAEGIENDKQKDLLMKMGCEIIQGYLVSQPLEKNKSYEIIKELNNHIIEEGE